MSDFLSVLARVIIYILFGLSFFWNCASGNIWITIHNDNSTDVQFIKKEYKEKRKTSLEFIPDGKVEETEFHITSMDVRYSNIDQLNMKGASFLYFKKKVAGKDRNCLLFTIDTSKDSPWFGYFRISEWSIKQFEKEANSRDDLARFNNLTDYMVWEFKLPGKIVEVKDYEPLGPDWWLSNNAGRKAILKIPAKDIFRSRRNYSTYHICSEM